MKTFIVMILLCAIASLACGASNRQDFYYADPAEGLTNYLEIGTDNGVDWVAQTFTATSSYNVTGVKLWLTRFSTPGTLTVSIKATTAGVPSGADLCSGTTDGDTLPDENGAGSFAPEYREVTFATEASLTEGTVYAIVCRALNGGDNNPVNWYHINVGTLYPGGTQFWNGVNGDPAEWEDFGVDCLFGVLGYKANPFPRLNRGRYNGSRNRSRYN